MMKSMVDIEVVIDDAFIEPRVTERLLIPFEKLCLHWKRKRAYRVFDTGCFMRIAGSGGHGCINCRSIVLMKSF